MSESFKILELLNILDNLKHLKRTGWLFFQVPEPETVASHMYRMAVLAMTLQQETTGNHLDVVKCVKMALVHDISEAIVGDITPHCGVSSEDKFKLEEKALKQIALYVPLCIGEEWLKLWHEYEDSTTNEALVVKQLDKIDLLAQAVSYESKYNIDLSEFFNSITPQAFSMQPFIEWSEQIRQSRLVKFDHLVKPF